MTAFTRVKKITWLFCAVFILANCGKQSEQTPGTQAAGAPATLTGYWYDSAEPDKYWVFSETQAIYDSEYDRTTIGITDPRVASYTRNEKGLVLTYKSFGRSIKREFQIQSLSSSELKLTSKYGQKTLVRMDAKEISTVFGPEYQTAPDKLIAQHYRPAKPATP